MVEQPESRLIRRVKQVLEHRLRPCWCVKLADAHTRGLPDIICLAAPDGKLLFIAVECKTKAGRVTTLQMLTGSVINVIGKRCGGRARFVVANSIQDVHGVIDEVTHGDRS